MAAPPSMSRRLCMWRRRRFTSVSGRTVVVTMATIAVGMGGAAGVKNRLETRALKNMFYNLATWAPAQQRLLPLMSV